MPQFKAGARESGEHLKSHKAIHDGELFLQSASTHKTPPAAVCPLVESTSTIYPDRKANLAHWP